MWLSFFIAGAAIFVVVFGVSYVIATFGTIVDAL